MTTAWIHGIHDHNLADLMADKPGTLLITEAIGCNPTDFSGGNYTRWTSAGYRVIVRLNNGYGSVGTIPGPEQYQDFATRCANYVGASPGCDIVIIGNEPNHKNERPGGQPITPMQYAKCYDMAYQAIKAACPPCQVGPAPVAPWDATTTYGSNPNGDWTVYFEDELMAIGKADFLALHTYTHGSQPSLIVDESRMDAPFVAHHFNFRAYQDFLAVIPHWFSRLPIYITETDQVQPWLDQNNGWVQAAYAEIDRWNASGGQAIHALCLYRSNRDDQWSFTDKRGVQDDFKAAMAKGYTVAPILPGPTPPDRPEPLPPTTPEPLPERDIDPELWVRGVQFDFVTPEPGTQYWRMTEAYWLKHAAADFGPDHHILGDVSVDGAQMAGVPLKVTWPSGATTVISKADDPHAVYNYDFGMSPSLNEFSIQVSDGKPSDKVMGIGMGYGGNPAAHSSTWVAFELVTATVTVPPKPEPPKPTPGTKLVHPVEGARITQHFYQNPASYAQFNLPGHNGTDFGIAEGTPVLSMAFGIVAFSGWDDAYGFYVRIAHDALGCYSFVAHLKEMGLMAGSVVQAGDKIGSVGNTGNSSGPHLHFEIRIQNVDGTYKPGTPMPKGRVDPQTFLAMHGLKL